MKTRTKRALLLSAAAALSVVGVLWQQIGDVCDILALELRGLWIGPLMDHWIMTGVEG